MTKKEIIRGISQYLSKKPNHEICVTEFQNKLRHGRHGMRAYCIVFDNGCVVCRPWSDSDYSWLAKLDRLTKDELVHIYEKCS